MSRVLRHLSICGIALFIAFAIGCEPQFEDDICEVDDDCFVDEECIDGRCVIDEDFDNDNQVETNECGGTAILEGSPGDPCGPCDLDQLECSDDGNALICDGETPCPELDVVTTQPTDVDATTATLNGDVQEFPHEEEITDIGFCWGGDEEPTHDGADCESLDAVPDQTGAFSLNIEELSQGTLYYTAVFWTLDDDETEYGNDVSFVTLAPTVEDVETEETSDAVIVTWSEADGAVGYEVLAGGDSVAEIDDPEEITDDGELTYEDETAPAGTVSAPGEFAASDDTWEGVELTWEPAESLDGPEVDYEIVAQYPDADSDPSEAVPGQRLGPEPTGYEAYIGDEEPDEEDWVFIAGSDATSHLFDDPEDAPLAVVDPGEISASDGEFYGHVLLEFEEDAEIVEIPVETYRLRATFGEDDESAGDYAEDEGQRQPDDIFPTWYRSDTDDVDGDYSMLPYATFETHEDTTAPEDGSVRHYFAEVAGPGAAAADTNTDSGFRAVAPAPEGLQASTDDADEVTLQWDSVDDADEYVIYADGDAVDTIDATDDPGYTTGDDAVVPEADLPPAPDPSAAGDAQAVTITWPEVSTDDSVHEVAFTVATVIDDSEGPQSDPATGYRAAPEISHYEITVEGADDWQPTDQSTEHVADAPPPAIVYGAPTAEDTSEGVALDLEELDDEVPLDVEDGDEQTWQLQTVDTAERTSDPAEVSGQRTADAEDVTARWMFEEEDDQWTELPDGDIDSTDASYVDEEIGDGETRNYRVDGEIADTDDTASSSDQLEHTYEEPQ